MQCNLKISILLDYSANNSCPSKWILPPGLPLKLYSASLQGPCFACRPGSLRSVTLRQPRTTPKWCVVVQNVVPCEIESVAAWSKDSLGIMRCAKGKGRLFRSVFELVESCWVLASRGLFLLVGLKWVPAVSGGLVSFGVCCVWLAACHLKYLVVEVCVSGIP